MRRPLSVALGIMVLSLLSACRSRPTNAVSLEVTEQGFVPPDVTVETGKPVTLTITRKTPRTCATEIVIADYGINQPLPLDQAVTVTFTPRAAGPIRYACGMNMVSGTITAR